MPFSILLLSMYLYGSCCKQTHTVCLRDCAAQWHWQPWGAGSLTGAACLGHIPTALGSVQHPHSQLLSP